MELTLDQAFEYCIDLWKWVAEEIARDPTLRVVDLKQVWMEKHPRFLWKVRSHCFFCEYATARGGGCRDCPGQFVDVNFHCSNREYGYIREPIKFYQKLVALYEEYLRRKEVEK